MNNKVLEQIIENFTKLGNRTAVDTGTKTFTYSELNHYSGKVAAYLMSNGIGRNDVVALKIPKSAELIFAILGVLRTGASYLPIDVKSPKERVNYVLKDSKAKYILTTDRGKGELNISDILVGTYDDFIDATVVRKPNDIFYVIYTSGSTGNPKGTAIFDKSVDNLVNWYVSFLGMTDHDRVLLIASPSFDLAQKNIFSALCIGATLTIPQDDLIFDDIVDFISETKSTILNWTPTTVNFLINTQKNASRLQSIRAIIVGGEQFDSRELVQWKIDNHLDVQIVNSYGPTESTDISTVYTVNSLKGFKNTPIGRPIFNVSTKVVSQLDGHEITGANEVGELIVSGIGISAGYIGIASDSFFEEGDHAYYRTGDLVCLNSEGNLLFKGRLDNQVKVNGHRIELEEIESLAMDFDSHGKFVVGIIDDNGLNKLKLWFTNRELSVKGLREFLQSRLPVYMVPSYYQLVDEIPLSDHGKVDQKKIRQSEISERGADPIEPGNDLLETLKAVLGTDFQLSSENLAKSFLSLGGNSLQAILLVTKLRQDFNVDVQLSTLLSDVAIEDVFGQMLYRGNTKNNTTRSLSIEKEEEGKPFRATDRTGHSIELMQKFDNSVDRNLYSLILSKKRIDEDTLMGAVTRVAKVHKILGMTLLENPDSHWEWTEIDSTIIPQVIDLKSTSYADNNELLKGLIRTKFLIPSEPFFKVWKISFKDIDAILLLTHHLASDALSMNILENDFLRVLADKEITEEKESVRDYSLKINENFDGDRLNDTREGAFWSDKLKNSFKYMLPVLNNVINESESENFALAKDFEIPTNIHEKINNLTKLSNSVIYMSAMNKTIAEWWGRDDFMVSLQVTGRNPELYNSIGYFVNTVYWPVSETSDKVLSEVNREMFNLIENQDMPDGLVRKLFLDGEEAPFFYNYKTDSRTKHEDNYSFSQVEYDYSGEYSVFDLIAEWTESQEGQKLTIVYRPRYFSLQQVDEFAVKYVQTLEGLLEGLEKNG